MMNSLHFFDCNMMVGRPNTLEAYQLWKTQDILDVMHRCGIDRAMVSSFEALEYHPVDGNKGLSELCGRTEGLHPVWTLLPGQTGEFPHGASLRQALEQNCVRMVRVYPSAQKHNYSLARWCAGEMLGVLNEKRIPVLLDASELSWDALHIFLCDFPALPVVLTNLNYRMDRALYPLLEQHENLYLETSGLKGFFSIEDICHRFGCNRLLFGTGMPINSAGAGVAIVEYSDISTEEKQKIAHKNLEEILLAVL